MTQNEITCFDRLKNSTIGKKYVQKCRKGQIPTKKEKQQRQTEVTESTMSNKKNAE